MAKRSRSTGWWGTVPWDRMSEPKGLKGLVTGHLHTGEIDKINEYIEENGSQSLYCWRVKYMEREKTGMNPLVLDWN